MTEHVLKSGHIFASRYRIERLLARGGFGAVYVAEQLATEAHVALKILWPHILGSDAAVSSFQQEARIAGRVNSDHIVRVVDAGFDDVTAMPYLVMELLDGRDLERLVEESGPLSPELTVELMRQVASALDRAHGYIDRDGMPRPIVHRDLKPENLFLCQRENGEPLIKVLDFGIAKVMSATAKVSREVKGTPLYMAHEQASGGVITPQTDIWALGLIVFFLLTGRSYWRSADSPEGSLTQLFGEVLSLPIAPPSRRFAELGIARSLPPAFDEWFLRCVNREPALRFASAGQAVSALGQALGMSLGPYSAMHPAGVELATVLSPRVSRQPSVPNSAAFDPTLHSIGTAQGLAVSGAEQPRASRKIWRVALVTVAGLVTVAAFVGAAILQSRLGNAPSAEPSAEAPRQVAGDGPSRASASPEVAPTALPVSTNTSEAIAAPLSSAEAANIPNTRVAGRDAGVRPVKSPARPVRAKPMKDEGLYDER